MSLPIQITPAPWPISNMVLQTNKKLIAAHLKRLSPEDRYLRFCSGLSDLRIDSYVEKINFSEDGLFAVYENKDIIAFLHIGRMDNNECEFGISVNEKYRRYGYARVLFDRGVNFAKMKGYNTIFMNCLYENQVMRHIVKRGGFEVESDLQEVTAKLKINSHRPLEASFINHTKNSIAFYDLVYRTKINQVKEFIALIRPL